MKNDYIPWLAGAGLGLGLGAALGVALDSLAAGILMAVGMSVLWGAVFSQAARHRNSDDNEQE